MRTLKSVSICLLLLCTVFSVVACQKKDVIHSEAEILAAAEEKISESVLWNRIFFIEGFPILEGGRTTGNYQEVDPAYLESIGMSRISEIISYGETLYSSSMMALFEETLFNSIKNGVGGVSTSAVCFDYTERIDGADRFICVMVDSNESPRFFASEVEYLFDTMQVEFNRNGRATVSLSVKKLGAEQGEDTLRRLRVNLSLENEVWLLDSYTFVVFPSEES